MNQDKFISPMIPEGMGEDDNQTPHPIDANAEDDLLALMTFSDVGLFDLFNEGEGDHRGEGVAPGEILDDFNPEFFNINARELSLAFMDEEADEEAERIQEIINSDEAARALQNITGTKAGRKIRELVRIKSEDFEEGIHRNAFLMIKHYAHQYAKVKVQPEDRLKAVEWLFCYKADSPNEISFDLCCRVLASRKDVVRLRMNYELWRQWMIYPYYFPFAVAPVPELIQGEIVFLAGEKGMDLAQEAWIKPGISQSEMIASAAGFDYLSQVDETTVLEYQKALDILEDRFIMSCQNENWYLTGRNPARQLQQYASERGVDIVRGGTASWSKLFG